jgi:hypothetical protein
LRSHGSYSRWQYQPVSFIGCTSDGRPQKVDLSQCIGALARVHNQCPLPVLIVATSITILRPLTCHSFTRDLLHSPLAHPQIGLLRTWQMRIMKTSLYKGTYKFSLQVITKCFQALQALVQYLDDHLVTVDSTDS